MKENTSLDNLETVILVISVILVILVILVMFTLDLGLCMCPMMYFLSLKVRLGCVGLQRGASEADFE